MLKNNKIKLEFNREELFILICSFIDKKIIYRNDEGKFLLDLNALIEKEPNYYEFFLEKPNEQIKIIKDILYEKYETSNFKISNFNRLKPISEIRTKDLDKLCLAKGMITKVTKVLAYIDESTWECPQDGTLINVKGNNPPKICSCGNKIKFRLLSNKLRDLQELELEEPQDELEGKQPQKIRIRLFDELTDAKFSGILQPGNKISVLGIAEKNDLIVKKEETIFEYRLLALDIIPLDEQFSEDRIDEEDEKQIIEISKDNPLEKLSDSLAPTIFGHEEIKKALVLQMVGGVKKKKAGNINSRNNIHILLCGDPGVSKTFMAKNVIERMPKSYYISGDATTKAGLTAIVDKDSLTGTWSLKAGALTKANDSLLVIDEIDKLNDDDRQSLHTPMESGEIVVNKADIHCSLKSDCSILGIANPKDGSFDLSGGVPIVKQIDIPSPLMSRFDIIFVMKDEINKDSDFSVVEIIYNNNSKKSKINKELFRKYITYARKLKPELDQKFLQSIQEFYHYVRKKSIDSLSGMRGMPITPRHLEGIIRLAEASAKIRLSNKVEEEDLEIAKDIFLNSLYKIGLDPETGTLDTSMTTGIGVRLSLKKKANIVSDLIYQNAVDSYISNETLYKIGDDNKISVREMWEVVELLNKEGMLIKKDTNGWGVGKLR